MKIWLIVAGLLILAGLLLSFGVMSRVNFDFTKLDTAHYQTVIHDITDSFDRISIDLQTAGVVFVPSESGQVRLVSTEKEEHPLIVTVQDGTLLISQEKSLDRFSLFTFGNPTLTVELPVFWTGPLSVDLTTGDAELPEAFCLSDIHLSVTTGDVRCSASSSGSIAIKATTGDIVMTDVRAVGAVELSQTTGDTTLTHVTCGTLFSTGTTGDLLMKDVLAEGSFSLTRGTGDICFDRCDAGSIFAKATTGDISGTLLTEKLFTTQATTGTIRVPSTTSGSKCELMTTTGDIFIDLT